MGLLSVYLLGPLHIVWEGRRLPPFRTNKAQALLVVLLLEQLERPRLAVSREQLVELLWPGMPAPSGLNNLRQALFQLRRAIPRVAGGQDQPLPLILATRHSIGINPHAAVDLDVARFESLARSAGRQQIQEAIDLYRGPFLADFYLPDSNEFEAWAAAWRNRLQRRALLALDHLAAAYLEEGDLGQAERYARRQLEIDPLHEAAYRRLMLALYEQGQRAAALREYEHVRQMLWDELGLEPDEETQKLAAAMHADRLETAAPQPPTASTAVTTAPALTTARAVPHTLPLPTTPLVGRQRELDLIAGFFARSEPRLVTITGEGGMGKTRLALGLAHHLLQQPQHPFQDGIHFIPLASLSDAAAMAPAIAAALQIAPQRNPASSPRRQLLDALRHKHMLLILDNFDHLLSGADLVAAMLQVAPHLRLLVTSRERLRLQGEQLLPLQGLAHGEDDPHNHAAQLFLTTARRLQPDFTLDGDDEAHLQRLCRLVQGMPLALELAATWVDALPLHEIVGQVAHGLDVLQAGVRDLPDRHRSMRAVFETSWQQLDADERRTFAALSVFRGGFTRAAAEAVAAASPQALSRLVDRSLLHYQRRQDRYHTHDLLRQAAAEKLQSAAHDAGQATRDRHMRFYLSLAEESEAQLSDVAQPLRLNRLEAERDNLHAALSWASATGDAETLARLSGALGVFWGIRGYLDEGRQWLSAALAQRRHISSSALAGVLFACGWLAFEHGDYARAKEYYRESHDLMRASGDAGRIARLLDSLGHATQQQGDFPQATRLCEDSLALYRTMNDQAGVARCLFRLGRLAELQGRHQRAVALIEESLQLRRAIGDERGVAASLNGLAELARFLGQPRRAETLYRESLAICQQLADKRCVAGLNHNLGHLALNAGDHARALRRFRDSLILYQELDNREGVALCLAGLGALHRLQGRLEPAILLLGAAAKQVAAHNVVMTAADQAAFEDNVAQLRRQTDPAAFADAWAQGQTLPLPEAIHLALTVTT